MKNKFIYLTLVLCAIGVVVAVQLTRKPATPVQPTTSQAQPAVLNTAVSQESIVASATEKPVPDAKAIVSPVQAIEGANGESLAVRWKAVRELSRKLALTEIQNLYGYLRAHENETNASMRGVLKNQLILALKAQEVPPAGLSGVLLEMFNDRDQDVVIRDYALQHLATWYEKADDKTAIQQALWRGVDETDSSIGGTALLALHRLAPMEPGLDPERVARSALTMVQSDGTGELARVTAMQVCAERKVTAALPAVLSYASSTSGALPLRLSAVAAVGSLGGQEQIAFLEGLQTDTNSPVRPAAVAALKKLKQGGKG